MLLSARRTHLQQAPVSGIASPPRSRPSGQRLRGGRDSGVLDSDDVLALARVAQGADPSGYRGEFLQGRRVQVPRSGRSVTYLGGQTYGSV